MLEDTILREPAQDTLDGLHEHLGALTAAVVTALGELVGELATFTWPDAWAISSRSDRAVLADEFAGFVADPPPVDLDALVMHPREAMRLGVMQRLRREQGEVPGRG